MILNTNEKNVLDAIVRDLETLAISMPEHSSLKSAMQRNAAALRKVIEPAVISRAGRADNHPC